MWGIILVLQSSGAVHLGVDNLGVVRHVGRLLGDHRGSVPFELAKVVALLPDHSTIWAHIRQTVLATPRTRDAAPFE